MPLVKGNLSGRFSPFTGRTSLPISASCIGVLQGINLGGPTSTIGDDTWGVRNLSPMITRNNTQGNPNSPCLELTAPAMWRFRWVVKPGQRQLSIRAKQIKTFPGQRPTLIIKKNSNVGINIDIKATAPEGIDWVVIGPIIFTATGTDVVNVEVHNNLQIQSCSAFFDHIVAI